MNGLTRLLSTTTIRPANSEANHRIELTPSDLQCLWIEYIHSGLLFNKPNESHVEHLKASLSLALDRFYPLAGRLVATEHDSNPRTTSFHVECSNAGAIFFHAEAVGSVKVADILNPLVPEIVACFFPMTGYSNYQASKLDLPLLAVQVTDLADGVFVAVSLNHLLVDGTTFWDFFNVWSELSRDDAAISRHGGFNFGRDYLQDFVDLPVRIPIHLEEDLITPPPTPGQQTVVLQFSKEKIAELKAKANAGSDREISSLQSLMAHLWVCITRNRNLPDDDLVYYAIMVSMRTRLNPPLPQPYLGNAIQTALAACTAGELLERGMGWAASQISEAIAVCAGMGVQEFYDSCTKSCGSSPASLAMIPPNMLITGGSPRFDVYTNDFGWGKPLLQRSHLKGNLSMAPGAVEGSIDVEASLLPHVSEALIADPEFTRFYQ